MATPYYQNKIDSLKDLFPEKDVALTEAGLRVGPRVYPIIDDVIVLCEPAEYTDLVRNRLGNPTPKPKSAGDASFAPDVQFSFGHEWTVYDSILGEHSEEFRQYFDLIDLEKLRDARVCDLGCGIGRWSHYLSEKAREVVLVDFSDAIFAARRNLRDKPNCLFFMGNIKRLPFREDFCDFLFCIGVLHHLPTPCLDEVRSLRSYARELLIYLYYNCDNRPKHYAALLRAVTLLRESLVKIKNPRARTLLSKLMAYGLYSPLVYAGKAVAPLGLSRYVPLYDGYHDKSVARMEQDVYDRFFTSIEQRVSRAEILELKDSFSDVKVSDGLPYWHFLCTR